LLLLHQGEDVARQRVFGHDLDATLIDEHVDVFVRAQTDLELRADGAHYRVAGVYQERS